MYILYNNGIVVDMFNPIPDYWEEDLSNEQIKSWKGNPNVIAQYVKNVNPKDISKYLVRWNIDEAEGKKAYEDDEYPREAWQMLDFMRKLGLSYPISDTGEPSGETFQFWTNEHKLKENNVGQSEQSNPIKYSKPWWRFW